MTAAIAPSRDGPRRTLRLSRPLDLRLTLGPLWHGLADPSMRLDGRTSAHRATRTHAGPASLALVMADANEVSAQAWGPGADAVLDSLPALLGEDDDDSGFAPRHSVVAALHRRFRGLRMTRSGAVFEALVPAVLAQRVTSIQAHTATLRLARLVAEPAPGPLGLHLPPSPQRLATLPSWEYHRLGIERQRADTLRRAARLARRLEEAATMARADAMRRLQHVPGIGPWTAASVAAVAFGDADAVPVGDYHLPHMVSWALLGKPRSDDATMLELLEPYRGHRGRVLRLLLLGGTRAPRFGPRRALRDISTS